MVGSGIQFWEKNKIDLDLTNITITVTDAVATNNGQDFVDLMRNRRNDSGYATTDSTDAALTTLDFTMGSEPTIDDIMLLQHNLGDYTLKYWNGASFVDFAPAIAVTGNTNANTRHRVTAVTPTEGKMQMIIQGTMVADADKFIRQMIFTQRIGQFANFPMIEDAEDGRRRRPIRMLSGKQKILKSTGNFSCTLTHNNQISQNDLTLQERLFDSFSGFLVSLGGFDEDQFKTAQGINKRFGYRNQDIFLMNCANEYEPVHEGGRYNRGTPINIELVETV